jgi:hypothetical protein
MSMPCTSLCPFPRGTCKAHVTVFPHPPYSSDIASRDFFLLRCMKEILFGRRFHSSEEDMTATREAKRDLPANISQWWSQQLYLSWQRWIKTTTTILRDDVVLFKCLMCNAASCDTYRFLCVSILQASSLRT